MDKLKIIFSSGGTGGHIFPTISAANFFIKKNYEVILVTDLRAQKYLNEQDDFKSYIIDTDTPFRKSLIKKIFSIFKIIISIIKSYFLLKKEKPNIIFGMGGYVSFPISFASTILKIPLIIYENNLIVGKSNRYLLPIAKKLFSSYEELINFPNKYKKKFFYSGHILREEILYHKKEYNKFPEKEISLLILGGSQGAEIFGKITPEVISMLCKHGFNISIYQQCLNSQKKALFDFYKKLNINFELFEFTQNINDYLKKTNFAITRCGASTAAELVETQTPFIAVPYPFAADNHQLLNAQFYEKKGCCWILEQKNLKAETLFNLIKSIHEDNRKLREKIDNMSKIDNKLTLLKIESEIKKLL